MRSLPLATMIATMSVALPAGMAFAAEPEAPPAAKADDAAEHQAKAPEQPDAVSAGEDDAEASKPAAKTKSAADKNSPQRFIPSEQVRADFDVSFPIDI